MRACVPWYAAVCRRYEALDRYPVRGTHALVLGSQHYWVEAMLLAWGAAHVTTVEYVATAAAVGPMHVRPFHVHCLIWSDLVCAAVECRRPQPRTR